MSCVLDSHAPFWSGGGPRAPVAVSAAAGSGTRCRRWGLVGHAMPAAGTVSQRGADGNGGSVCTVGQVPAGRRPGTLEHWDTGTPQASWLAGPPRPGPGGPGPKDPARARAAVADHDDPAAGGLLAVLDFSAFAGCAARAAVRPAKSGLPDCGSAPGITSPPTGRMASRISACASMSGRCARPLASIRKRSRCC